MTTKRLPNFFIIGAARSATSSLWFYLREHPDIFMSPDKEAQFFGFFDTPERAHKTKYRTLEEYAELFDEVRDEKIIGEATPTYLALPESAASIHEHCPDARLLASLRNPVDRAFSYYEMSMSKGHGEKQSFEQWMQGNRFWLEQGGYADHLERYLALFEHERLKLVLFEDIQQDAASVVADIHAWLGVDVLKPEQPPPAYNKGGKPRNLLGAAIYRATTNRSLNRMLRPFVPGWGVRLVHGLRGSAVSNSEMSDETRARLIDHFRDDILRTQDIIDRDLQHWLET